MITITQLSGEIFSIINYDKNNSIEYNEMKKLFDTQIVITSYYMLVNNDKNIYTNLYDIYEMKFKKDIILDDLNIIFLPYNKKDVEYIKKKWNVFYDNIDFPNDNLRNDKLFVLMAVNKFGIYYKNISNELKYDMQIIYNAALNDFNCLEYIPNEYKNNKEFIKKYLSYNGCNIRFASEELKNDDELVNIAISNDYSSEYVLKYLNNLYKDNEEFIIPILNKYPNCFEYISKRLQNKKEIIMLCINNLKKLHNNYNYILYLINDVNKNDKEIVLPLVSMNGRDISYISGNLALDKDIVYAAIKNDPTAYKYIDKSFFNNKEFILLCLGNNYGYDEENYENFLQYLDDEFRNDEEIVIACMKKCCKNIMYCSKKLCNVKEVILTAINHCYYIFDDKMNEHVKIRYIKERTKNIDIILEKTKLKNDPDILTQIIKNIKII